MGSGPFKCVEWKKNSYVQLVANPTWWGPKPKIDEIYFTYYTNGDTMLQDLKAGTIDGARDLGADADHAAPERAQHHGPRHHHRRLRRAGLQLLHGPSKGHPVLKDVKFRQALNYAVDRRRSVDLVMGGSTTPGTTIIPPNYYHDPDWHWEPPADVKYTFDPEMAKQKLDEAGYKDTDGDGVREYKGKPIELRPDRARGVDAEQRTGKLIAGWFERRRHQGQAGGRWTRRRSATASLNYEGDTFTPDYDMFLWGWYLDYDPGSMLSYFTKGQIGNWSETCWIGRRSTTSSTSSRARSSTRPSARR